MFTIRDWNLWQTVTFTRTSVTPAWLTTVGYSTTGGNYSGPSVGYYASIIFVGEGTTTSSLLLSPSSLRVPEGGDSSYTVKLSEEPWASVKVDVGLPSDTDLTLDKESLTFTAANWSEAQTVTVTAAEDDDTVDDTMTLLHAAVGGGFGAAVAHLQLSVIDDDAVRPSLRFSPPSLAVAEGGNNTYTVKLATEPSATVTVGIAGHSGTDLSLDKESLTFTAANWSEAQTVTVTAAEDDDAGDDEVTLTHAASGGDYGSVADSVAVTVIDDDAAVRGLLVSPPSLAVAEGATTPTR